MNRRYRKTVIAGSGKTTQLPKMALEFGTSLQQFHNPAITQSRNPAIKQFRIACTQPRRLAAVTMAERVAHELKGEVGGLVGYQHRFGRKISRETCIKFMTDGVLLAETRSATLMALAQAQAVTINQTFKTGHRAVLL